MNMKRVIFVGTMIVTMSFAGTAWSKSAISADSLSGVVHRKFKFQR